MLCMSIPAMAQKVHLLSLDETNECEAVTASCDNDQENDQYGKFDPEKYQRDLEAFIAKEARLTQQEAQAFFPILRELQAKQRAIYMRQHKLSKEMFTNNKVAAEAIREHDNQEIEIKKLQQNYHNRFLKVIPATKVLICIHAEERFNRNMMKNMTRH